MKYYSVVVLNPRMVEHGSGPGSVRPDAAAERNNLDLRGLGRAQ
jgi:hypothetical protein